MPFARGIEAGPKSTVRLSLVLRTIEARDSFRYSTLTLAWNGLRSCQDRAQSPVSRLHRRVDRRTPARFRVLIRLDFPEPDFGGVCR